MRKTEKRYVIYRTKIDERYRPLNNGQFWAIARDRKEMDRIIDRSWKYGESFSFGWIERELPINN
jgi:hypothetical protein